MATQSAQQTKHFVSPHLIGPQFLANQHETNQHKSAALIGLFHATSLVLQSVESYRNYRKTTQRGVQGCLSSLQQRVQGTMMPCQLTVSDCPETPINFEAYIGLPGIYSHHVSKGHTFVKLNLQQKDRSLK